MNMVKEIFKEEEAERIYSMAINPNRQIDQLIWIGMSTEEFSVKSA